MVTISAFDISPDSPVRFGPFTVHLRHDTHAENPWQMWDCQTPLIYGGGRDGVTVHDSGDGIRDFFDRVSGPWVSRHWRKICAALDLDPAEHDQEAREAQKDWGGDLGEVRRDCFREYLDGSTPGYGWSVSAYLDALVALYELAGVPVLKTTVTGYCQGDWADVLLVATPEHAARCGYNFKKPGFDMAESLKGDAELLRSWLFGDVFGYSIEGPDGDTLDSCYGFYGCYFDGDPQRGGYVLTAAADALKTAVEEKFGVAVSAEFAARGDYLELRTEWKAARKRAGTLAGGAVCRALEKQARDLAARWKEARKMRRECAAILAA